jgi:hypothetical protein
LLIVEGFHEPAILLFDVPANIVAAPPLQKAVNAVKVGVIVAGLIVCTSVAVVAHWPAVGVNVYVPVVVLLTVDGFHAPLIGVAFVEEPESIGAVAPVQIAVNALKVGVVGLLTVCTIVVVTAHWPAFGVNVYVPVDVLLIVEGLHEPAILLFDVPAKVPITPPLHIGVKAVNVGVIVAGLIVCTRVAVVAHWPAVGVNVYVPVVVLLTADGFHAPLIGVAFVEEPESIGAVAPVQIAVNALKVGVVGFVIV